MGDRSYRTHGQHLSPFGGGLGCRGRSVRRWTTACGSALGWRAVEGGSGTALSTGAAPNDLWCADFKGEFKLGNGRYCFPLTVTDHASRYLLLCEALESTRENLAITAFEQLFQERGLPQAVRSDNGVPFASPNGLFNLSKLSVWWLRLGIAIERIKPGHPQQNGRHERMHLTLKKEATRRPGMNSLQQQARFDDFRRFDDKGVEVVAGDYLDLGAMRRAVKGVRRAYFVYPIRPGIIQATAYFAQATKEAGVEAITNMSQISAREDARSHAARDHWVAERVFDWSGIAVAHLRPTFFAEWLLYNAPMIKAGTLAMPFGAGNDGPVPAENQARVIVGILENPAPR